jgi:hypothetical protein
MTATAVANEVVVPLYNERRMITAVHQAMVAFVGRHPDWCGRRRRRCGRPGPGHR